MTSTIWDVKILTWKVETVIIGTVIIGRVIIGTVTIGTVTIGTVIFGTVIFGTVVSYRSLIVMVCQTSQMRTSLWEKSSTFLGELILGHD